jgi:hypothetical protein
MSNDAFGQGADLPPRLPDPFGYPGDGPGGSAEISRAVRGRVQAPAIALIIVGVVNLLLGAGAALFGLQAANTPEALVEQQLEVQQPGQLKQFKQMGWSVRDILNFYLYGGIGGGALGLVTALLAILGGARMLALKSYGLAVFASVLVAIPFISCSACCGLGEGIGIWSVVVLMNEEVKAAFRQVAQGG